MCLLIVEHCSTFLGLPQAAPILFSFRLPVCNARPLYRYYLYIYVYLYIYMCVPTRNRNNEFILEFILREIKMADFER